MKKIIRTLFIVILSCITNQVFSQVPQWINAWYNYRAIEDSIAHRLPRSLAGAPYLKDGLIYWNGSDSLPHFWTGYNERTFAGSSGIYQNLSGFKLGQPLNQSGNPAKLLNASEIPLNGFPLYVYDTLNNSIVKSSARLFDTIYTTVQTVPIKTIQNKTAGFFQAWQPYNYGVAYTSAYRPGTGIMKAGMATSGYVSAISLDAMPDNVYEIWGYNSDPTGGRHDTSDASVRVSMETNFLNTLDATVLNFEFHVPEVTDFSGNIHRTNSYYISKTNGYCKNLLAIDDMEFNSIYNNATYAQIGGPNNGVQGVINLYGQTNGVVPDGILKINNTIDGSFSQIQSLQGNLFIGNSGNSNANISNVTLWTDNNLWLGRSTSLNTNTWKGVLIGMDSTGHNRPDNSAVLELQSVHRGFLPPRMTTDQKLAISSPGEGDIVYDLTLHKLCVFTGSVWETITSL